MQTLTLPRTLGRYRLVRLLGAGGMGAVYLGEVAGPLGVVQKVAVKLVHPHVMQSDPQAIMAMADEARLLATLRHQNIVGLRSFETIPDRRLGDVPALVLEYVAGCSLESMTRTRDARLLSLPPAAARLVLDDLLAGLQHAHTAVDDRGAPLGLVHRDLKPANVLVDVAGRAQLLDFGVAWAVEKLVRTGTNMTKGTLPWMSPEQLSGERIDGRSDLFSLGLLAFEILTGTPYTRRPQKPRHIAEIAMELATTTFADRRPGFEAVMEPVVGARITAALAEWLGRLLALQAEERFESAEQARIHAARIPWATQGRRGREWLAERALGSDPEFATTGSVHAAAASSDDEATRPFPAQPPGGGRASQGSPAGPTRPMQATGLTDPEAVVPIDRKLLANLLRPPGAEE